MPNLVNSLLIDELKSDFGSMGSCLIVSFDKLTVAEAESIRKKFRDAGFKYRVVKNSLALKVFGSMNLDLAGAFQGKCGVVLAPEESAILAAQIVRESVAKAKVPPVVVTGAVIEGHAITGAASAFVADMPTKHVVRGQLAGTVLAPARAMAVCVSALAAGLARCVQAKIDKQSAS